MAFEVLFRVAAIGLMAARFLTIVLKSAGRSSEDMRDLQSGRWCSRQCWCLGGVRDLFNTIKGALPLYGG